MTKTLLPALLYLSTLWLTIFLDLPYSVLIGICLTILYLSHAAWLFYRRTTQTFDGELVIHRQNKSVRPLFILFALILTTGYFANDRLNVLLIVLFWLIVLFEITLSVMSRRIKPVAFVIQGSKLLIVDRFMSSRNLTHLKSINLNGATNTLELRFKEAPGLRIKCSEFCWSDLQSLISICMERSEELVTVSENLRKTSS